MNVKKNVWEVILQSNKNALYAVTPAFFVWHGSLMGFNW